MTYELESHHERRFMAKYCDRWCYFGNGTPATQQQTQSQSADVAPWSGAIPYIDTGLQASQDLYNQGGPQYYPGQTYAPENAGQSSAISGLENTAAQTAPLTSQIGSTASSIMGGPTTANPSNSFFQGLTTGNGPGSDTLNSFSNGSMLSAQNPYFQQVADTTAANVLPGINAQFANAGRGSSGLAARAASEGLGDAIGGLAYNNYQQGLGQQQSAATSLAGLGVQGAQGLSTNYQNSVNNTLNSATTGANLTSLLQSLGINANTAGLAAATTQQGLDQQPITAAMNQYNYNQQLPYENLQNYISNITGQTQGDHSTTSTGTTSGTSTPAQPSFWNQLLGAGATAASFFV